jgi:hypothetical protein
MFKCSNCSCFDDSKVVGLRQRGLAGMKAILAEFKPSGRTGLIAGWETKRATPLTALLLFI